MLPVSATMSNEISSFRQSRNKLNMFNLFRLCRKNRSTCSIRQCCFDIVAGVDGALVMSCSLLSSDSSHASLLGSGGCVEYLWVADVFTEDMKTTAFCRQQHQRQLQPQQLSDVTGGYHCLRRLDIAMVMVIFTGQSAVVIRRTIMS